MKSKIIVIGIFIASIFTTSCSNDKNKPINPPNNNKTPQTEQGNYVIMLSLDGFRYDYIDKYDAKNLKKIAKKGVRVERMNPSNPTKTFPNHYTLVTGLYPDNHGLINNSFYDSELGKYKMSDRNAVKNGKFYGGEPIWNTAKKAGIKTASYFWVGSEAKINGMQPDIWKEYNHKTSFKERINSVINWLKLPNNERPRLITLYYNEPDSAGHHYGTNNQEVKEQVKYVDEQVGILYDKLMQLPIAENINFIIVSDHGMRDLEGTKNIFLDDYISINNVYISGGNPVYTINVKDKNVDKVYNKLKNVKNLYVYKQGEAPKELHIANHHRTGDLMVIGKPPYGVYPVKENFKPKKRGVHGYLNSDEQMGAIFIATGNTFKVNYTQKSINNTDVYNLIAHILNIKPAKNDGNFKNVKTLLK
ncbi:MAG: alkaline phosphatase family protein [Tenacibaculum sp.]|nr:alkaline phosphatase family protein [Tenacibaculum sp.]